MNRPLNFVQTSLKEWIFWDTRYWACPPAELFAEATPAPASLSGPGGRGQLHPIIVNGQPCLHRHYRRGGWIRFLSSDHYVWAGLRNTRVFRECELLQEMRTACLPVPTPLTARVRRSGWTYTQDIIMEEIPECRNLVEILQGSPLAKPQWQRIGHTLAMFCRKGYYHADLNACNVLIDAKESIHLVDFDRGRAGVSPKRFSQAVRRLCHSLNRWKEKCPALHASRKEQEILWQAYHDGLAV